MSECYVVRIHSLKFVCVCVCVCVCRNHLISYLEVSVRKLFFMDDGGNIPVEYKSEGHQILLVALHLVYCCICFVVVEKTP